MIDEIVLRQVINGSSDVDAMDLAKECLRLRDIATALHESTEDCRDAGFKCDYHVTPDCSMCPCEEFGAKHVPRSKS